MTERERWRRLGWWLLGMTAGSGVGFGFFLLGCVLHDGWSEFFGGLGCAVITVVATVGCFVSCRDAWREMQERLKR